MKLWAVLVLILLCFEPAQAQDAPEIFAQLGHSEPSVNSVAYTPDGRLIATGSDDDAVKLWDVASGRELRTLNGHTTAVTSVAFSLNGRVLASGSIDATVRLWDVANGSSLGVIQASGSVTSIAFSPVAQILAAGISSGSHSPVELYDLTNGRSLLTLDASDSIRSVAFSPDGRIVASGGDDKSIKLWDVASGRKLRTLIGHGAEVTSVAFTPDGQSLASGSRDKTIKLWDVSSGRLLRTLSGHTDAVKDIALSPDGSILGSASADELVRLWDIPTGRMLRSLKEDSNAIAFSPDGKTIAAGTYRGADIWGVESGNKLRELAGRAISVRFVEFSPDSRALNVDGNLWDLASGRVLRALPGYVVFSPDGKFQGSRDGPNIKLFDISGNELRSIKADSGHFLQISSGGRFLASDGDGNTIKLWDAVTGRALRSLGGHAKSVNAFAFSPDGRMLASASDDNTVKLWDVTSGRTTRTFKVGCDPGAPPSCLGIANSVTFSPDGRILVGGGNGGVNLWDVARGRELRAFKHEKVGALATWVNGVAVSPDSGIVASASFDKTIKLWDAASGREITTLRGHLGSVHSVAFSKDGRFLASGGEDGTVKLWELPAGTLKASFLRFNGGSSLAITPEGYYDASSEKAEDNLNVRVGNRVFPIGAYRDKFFRPDLVKLSLAGQSLEGVSLPRIASIKVAPVVEIVDLPPRIAEPKLAVSVRITDGGGGIGQVRLFLNGTAIVQDDARAPSPAPDGGPVTRTYTIQLAAGANALKADAYNADNTMRSSSAVVTTVFSLTPVAPPVAGPVVPPAVKPAAIPAAVATGRGNLHALVLGIQEFKNPNFNLAYPVADAQLFAETLQQVSAPLFGKADIRLLTKPAETTRESLIAVLKDMQAGVGADNLFVFYVASHGVTDDGEYFLITSNVTTASSDHLKREAVSKDELTALIANIAATKKLLVIDTCFAEALGNAVQARLLTRGLDEATALKILSRAVGTTVLAASTSTQQAMEGYEGHGLFTYVVAEGLKGKGDVDRNGFVNTLGLAHYVDAEVPNLAEHVFNHAQYPTVETNGQAFPLAKVR